MRGCGVGLLVRVLCDVVELDRLGQRRAPDELPVAAANAGAEGLDVVDEALAVAEVTSTARARASAAKAATRRLA